MADFSMTYEALETAASQINTAKSDLEQVISFLDSAISTLGGGFVGESYNAFANAWQESKPTMQKLAEAVGNFAPELNKAVQTQQTQVSADAGRMAGLKF